MSRLLNLNDVAERTGIALGTIRHWVNHGKSPFPFRKLGGRIVIAENELERAIENLPMRTEKTR